MEILTLITYMYVYVQISHRKKLILGVEGWDINRIGYMTFLGQDWAFYRRPKLGTEPTKSKVCFSPL